MFYRIRKPSDTEEWPFWTRLMDYLDNKLINLNDYKIKENRDNKKQYIEIDSYLINVNWLKPAPNPPKKIEKNIRG